MSNTDKRCVLKSKDGQFVTVRSLKGNSLTLCAVDAQDTPTNAASVYVQKNQLAFKFKRDGLSYSPKVDKSGALVWDQIDNQLPILQLPKCHRFEKYDAKSGKHYGLRSVGDPKQYLYVKTESPQIVSIRPTDVDCVLIRYE